MAFSAIIDVIKRILEEPVPEGTHPILALAKTDQEKQLKSKPDEEDSDDETSSQPKLSKTERNAWLRQVAL